jgi:Polyketide cyclase / dehydrase and lipid transport
MTRVRGSIEIARPVEEVFDFVADQRNEVRYNSQMTGSTKITEGPIGPGTRFRATILSRGKPVEVRIEHTGSDRPRSIASRSVMEGSVATGQVRFEPIPSGTLFSWDWDVSVSGAARFAGPLVGLLGRRQERRIWTGLKRLLEEQARSPRSSRSAS